MYAIEFKTSGFGWRHTSNESDPILYETIENALLAFNKQLNMFYMNTTWKSRIRCMDTDKILIEMDHIGSPPIKEIRADDLKIPERYSWSIKSIIEI